MWVSWKEVQSVISIIVLGMEQCMGNIKMDLKDGVWIGFIWLMLL